MAEKVIVKGGGTLDGAQFDNAATEATLRELIKTVKEQKCCGEGGDKKLEALANRALKENVSGLNDNTAAHQSSAKDVSSLGKAAKATGSLLTSGISALAGGAISGFVYAGEAFVKFFTESLDAFRETSSVGASFNNDLVMMRKTAANAGLSLEDFTAMVGKNSKLMASLGGTTTKGAIAFSEMSGQIRSSEFGKNMQMTGMTTGDLNDYLSGYLETQQRLGKIEGKIGEKERQGAEAYIEEMDRMTKMTGVSRQEGQNALRTAMKDGKALNLASKLSGQALLNFQSGLTLMNTTLDPSAMKSLSNMMSGVIDPGDRFAKMLTQASPGIMNFQRAMGKGQLSAEQQVKGYKQQEKSIGDYLSRFSDEQIARDANLTQLREYQASLKKYKTMNYDDAVKEQKANNALTKAVASFGQVFQDIKSKILGAMLNSKVFEKFETVLQKIAKKFDEYAKPIGDFLASFIDGIDKAITGDGTLMDGISAAFSSLFAKLTPIVSEIFRDLFEGITGQGGNKEKRKALEARKAQVTAAAGFADQGLEDPAIKKALEDIQKELDGVETKSPMGLALEYVYDNVFSLKGLLIGGAGLTAVLGGLWAAFALAPAVLKPFAAGVAALANPGSLIGLAALTLAAMGVGKALEYMTPFMTALGPVVIKVADVIGNVLIAAIDKLPEIFRAAGEAINPLVRTIGDVLITALNRIPDVLGKIDDIFKSVFSGAEGILNGFARVFDSIFGNIKGTVEAFVDGFKAIPMVIGKLSEIDPGKLANVGKALVPLGKALLDISGSAAILKLFGPEGLIRLADSLVKFEAIDASKISGIAPPLADLHRVLSLFTGGGGFLQGVSNFFGNFLTGDNGIGAFVESFKKFNQIDSGNLTAVVTSIGNMKNVVGADFSRQADGVNTFTAAIKNLNIELKALNIALKEMSAPGVSGGRGQPPGRSNLDTMAAVGANTGGGAASEKLNTLVTELVSLTKDIKESSKDQADALKGRRDAL